MFDNLRNAFSSAAKSFSEKELKEKDIGDVLFQLEIALMESDVAVEVIESIKTSLKEQLIGTKINKNEIENFVKNSLIQSISGLLTLSQKLISWQTLNLKKILMNLTLSYLLELMELAKLLLLQKLHICYKNQNFH
jgi:fused signal recognition particle receptor